VRQDIPYGVQCAQLVHAAGESFARPDTSSAVYAVVLAAKDELVLLELERTLQREGITHTAIREPDEPWNGALMAIGLPPQDRKPLRRLLGKYQLVR
jgi:hypothetical protein